jgi:hypothetical protein
MAVPFERIVLDDLNMGTGTVEVTMPGGGTQTGTQISLLGILEGSGIPQPTLATGTGKTVDQVIAVLQTLGLVKQS